MLFQVYSLVQKAIKDTQKKNLEDQSREVDLLMNFNGKGVVTTSFMFSISSFFSNIFTFIYIIDDGNIYIGET
jgi:hypothetical protein